jgi:methylenetetrahydrofolate dehydrogenase (NADP+)/methenyltetrahydrofolate cyclohydrolase
MQGNGDVPATVLDGKTIALDIKSELKCRVDALAAQGVTTGLGTILVGSDAGARSYVNWKHRDCQELGIESLRRELPSNVTEAHVLETVMELNCNPSCTGFIVQLPLPAHIDMRQVLRAIDPLKDADGLHPFNLGNLVLGADGPLPCTPRGIIKLLQLSNVGITGAQFCVIGCGITVGRPLGLMLTGPAEHATVTMCHEATHDVAAHTRVADVVVAAAGVAHLVKSSWIRPGATVLSVGLTRTVEGILGDVHPDVGNVAGQWTRPTGGGPHDEGDAPDEHR